jgi:hypothetical protein
MTREPISGLMHHTSGKRIYNIRAACFIQGSTLCELAGCEFYLMQTNSVI